MACINYERDAMNFNEYQIAAAKFAVYPDTDYPRLGLAEETGELLGLFAKLSRGDDLNARFGSYQGFAEAVKKEMGDVLWMLSAIATDSGFSLGQIAELNIQKLTDRQGRGALKGSGDER